MVLDFVIFVKRYYSYILHNYSVSTVSLTNCIIFDGKSRAISPLKCINTNFQKHKFHFKRNVSKLNIMKACWFALFFVFTLIQESISPPTKGKASSPDTPPVKDDVEAKSNNTNKKNDNSSAKMPEKEVVDKMKDDQRQAAPTDDRSEKPDGRNRKGNGIKQNQKGDEKLDSDKTSKKSVQSPSPNEGSPTRENPKSTQEEKIQNDENADKTKKKKSSVKESGTGEISNKSDPPSTPREPESKSEENKMQNTKNSDDPRKNKSSEKESNSDETPKESDPPRSSSEPESNPEGEKTKNNRNADKSNEKKSPQLKSNQNETPKEPVQPDPHTNDTKEPISEPNKIKGDIKGNDLSENNGNLTDPIPSSRKIPEPKSSEEETTKRSNSKSHLKNKPEKVQKSTSPSKFDVSELSDDEIDLYDDEIDLSEDDSSESDEENNFPIPRHPSKYRNQSGWPPKLLSDLDCNSRPNKSGGELLKNVSNRKTPSQRKMYQLNTSKHMPTQYNKRRFENLELSDSDEEDSNIESDDEDLEMEYIADPRRKLQNWNNNRKKSQTSDEKLINFYMPKRNNLTTGRKLTSFPTSTPQKVSRNQSTGFNLLELDNLMTAKNWNM